MGKVPNVFRYYNTKGIQGLSGKDDVSVQSLMTSRGTSCMAALRPKAGSRLEDRGRNREKSEPCPELIEPFEASGHRPAAPQSDVKEPAARLIVGDLGETDGQLITPLQQKRRQPLSYGPIFVPSRVAKLCKDVRIKEKVHFSPQRIRIPSSSSSTSGQTSSSELSFVSIQRRRRDAASK
jgi:hypothetical protein